MARNTAVVGAQWGDEGKGKVVDVLAARYDFVVRFQGGHNAGHSVVFDGKTFAVRLLPSGIFHRGAVNVIGNGVVVDPLALAGEIDELRQAGIHVGDDNLKISDRTHLILPFHSILDQFRDAEPGQVRIGTTGRGIGPAYEWKASRKGFRFCDILDLDAFWSDLERELARVNRVFGHIEALAQWSFEALREKLEPVLTALQPHVVDTVDLLHNALEAERSVLFEGAQATLLDIDFGTYPYVTSSNSCAAGISAGSGVPAKHVSTVVGIFKAYMTRVGEGPFPTELDNEIGQSLRDKGHEYGTNTKRPRRCGWLDLVALRHARRINGFDSLAMMKLDVMSGLDTVKICTGYKRNGQTFYHLPASARALDQIEPVFHEMPGWQENLTGLRSFDQLPESAKAYVAFIEEYLNCPIGMISVGPDRSDTIVRDAVTFER